jgi:arylsulfatase A-like enzyme
MDPRVPAVAKGKVSRALVQSIDFAPTMLDLLGKPPHPQCAGRSRAGLLRGESAAPDFVFLQWSPSKEPIHAHSKIANEEEIQRVLDESTRAVVSPDGWKLCLRDKDKNELYNLRNDPNERRNLYYQQGHRDVIVDLTNRIHRWQQSVGDGVVV